MYTKNLLLFLALSVFTIGAPVFGQITINRADFIRQEVFTDTVVQATPGGIQSPTEGPGQTWDYSSLVQLNMSTTDYHSAAGSPHFPEALNYYETDLFFYDFPIEADRYHALDDQGIYEQGRLITNIKHGIGSITGNPNDSLRFVGRADVYDGRLDFVQFPLSYQDEWTQSHIEELQFELSAGAFGLVNAPGSYKEYVSQERTVVGYGSLIIPNFDGEAGEPMEALLIRIDDVIIDSVFLFGEPAPPVLMQVFGLTQGSVSTSMSYVFYRQYFGAPALRIETLASVNSAFYRPQAIDITTMIAEHNTQAIKLYPNPVYAGRQLTILAPGDVQNGYFNLYDLTGKVVVHQSFETNEGGQTLAEVPASLRSGLYMYGLYTTNGTSLGRGKLQVR